MSRSSAMSRPPGVAPSIAAESAALRRPSLVPRTPIAPTEERRPPVALILGDPLEIGSLKSGLIQAGAPVATASDGPTALRLIEQRRPAVIVIDLWLPGLTGLDVLRRLRYRAPAFLVAEFTSPQLRNDVVAAGALGLIVRPVTPEALYRQISPYITWVPRAGATIWAVDGRDTSPTSQ